MGTVASINGTPNSPPGKSILVTGAAGFIGANFVLEWLGLDLSSVISLDKLTYAGNLDNLVSVANDSRHVFVHGNIGDGDLIASLLNRYRPTTLRRSRMSIARSTDPPISSRPTS
jgi:dTDP-D-glucose 4,6-dehydratase